MVKHHQPFSSGLFLTSYSEALYANTFIILAQLTLLNDESLLRGTDDMSKFVPVFQAK